jgi:hypothetical protein
MGLVLDNYLGKVRMHPLRLLWRGKVVAEFDKWNYTIRRT